VETVPALMLCETHVRHLVRPEFMVVGMKQGSLRGRALSWLTVYLE
jgi:hypothetical protein